MENFLEIQNDDASYDLKSFDEKLDGYLIISEIEGNYILLDHDIFFIESIHSFVKEGDMYCLYGEGSVYKIPEDLFEPLKNILCTNK